MKKTKITRIYCEQEIHTARANRPGCVVSVFSDTSSVHVILSLPLVDTWVSYTRAFGKFLSWSLSQ